MASGRFGNGDDRSRPKYNSVKGKNAVRQLMLILTTLTVTSNQMTLATESPNSSVSIESTTAVSANYNTGLLSSLSSLPIASLITSLPTPQLASLSNYATNMTSTSTVQRYDHPTSNVETRSMPSTNLTATVVTTDRGWNATTPSLFSTNASNSSTALNLLSNYTTLSTTTEEKNVTSNATNMTTIMTTIGNLTTNNGSSVEVSFTTTDRNNTYAMTIQPSLTNYSWNETTSYSVTRSTATDSPAGGITWTLQMSLGVGIGVGGFLLVVLIIVIVVCIVKCTKKNRSEKKNEGAARSKKRRKQATRGQHQVGVDNIRLSPVKINSRSSRNGQQKNHQKIKRGKRASVHQLTQAFAENENDVNGENQQQQQQQQLDTFKRLPGNGVPNESSANAMLATSATVSYVLEKWDPAVSNDRKTSTFQSHNGIQNGDGIGIHHTSSASPVQAVRMEEAKKPSVKAVGPPTAKKPPPSSPVLRSTTAVASFENDEEPFPPPPAVGFINPTFNQVEPPHPSKQQRQANGRILLAQNSVGESNTDISDVQQNPLFSLMNT